MRNRLHRSLGKDRCDPRKATLFVRFCRNKSRRGHKETGLQDADENPPQLQLIKSSSKSP